MLRPIRTAALSLFTAITLNVSVRAGEFPYVAYVNSPDAYVRSGPGSQHYPTGQLPVGYAVEVYRHDGEGWCAIRPPQGSFSFAPAHQLKILDSRTAEVSASGVVARVGSAVGNQRNAVQVLLERGEAVQLVEQPKPGEPWVKIAPPAGEFRWIAARRLSRTPPTEGEMQKPATGGWVKSPDGSEPMAVASHIASPGAGPINSASASPEIAPGDSFAHLNSPVGGGAPNAHPVGAYPAWHPESIPSNAPVPATPSTDDISVVAGSPAEVVLAQHQATGDAGSALGQPRVRFPGMSVPGASGSASTGPVDPRVAEMQLRLSQVVVQPPTAWQLGGLRSETAALLASEQSPEVRNQLRDLLDRIATFEAVQSRYRPAGAIAQSPGQPTAPNTFTTVGGAAAPLGAAPTQPTGLTGQSGDVLARVRADLGVDNTITPTPGAQPAAVASTAAGAGATAAAPATEALYDAVGTLKPVVSRRDQAPRFALVDDHGDVVTFVTAAADVNLQAYVGKRIGVRGNRGFMPEYRRAHVTASRVTPLEEKLIR